MQEIIKLKQFTLCILMCTSTALTSAQTLKLYFGTSYQNDLKNQIGYNSSYAYSQRIGITLYPISLAITTKLKKGRLIEYELGSIYMSKTSYFDSLPNGKLLYTTNVINISSRVEYIKKILTDNNKQKWALQLGEAIQPFYKRSELIPATTNQTPYNVTQWGIKFHVIPHIQYNVNKDLILDANFPFFLFSVGSTSQHTENISIPIDNRKYSFFDFEPFLKSELLSMRLGLCYKF